MAVMLLEWVFTSAFLILVVLALRAALGKRVSAGLRYALWAVVLVRLLVPVQLFTSPIAGTWVLTEKRTERNLDLPAPTFHIEEGTEQLLDKIDGPSAVLFTVPQVPDAPAVPDAPEPPDLNHLPGWTGYLGWAWLAGSVLAVLVLLASNLRFYGRLRRERVPLEGTGCPLRVYAAVGLPSPCLFGIVRPAVYVTPEAAADPDMLRHVLAHEHTHYRHGDHIWSLLRCAALAVHWWNPLVWLAARLSRRDAELACDEGALKRLGDGERAGYGNTLLTLVTAKPRPGDLLRCATTMAGDKKSLKERVSRIACAPRRILWAAVAAVLVTALACVCAFGQAAEEPDRPAPDPDSAPSAPNAPSAPSAPGAPAESSTPVDADEPAFDLSFSMDDDNDVKITGRAYDAALEYTYWHPAYDADHPISYLSMHYPVFDGGLDDVVEAWWGDDGHTLVMLNTSLMAMFSSYYPTGYWAFTVDVSGEQAVVTEMTSHVPDNLREPDGEPVLIPETVTDAQAVTLARVAARLMTAAEDYYQNNAQDYWKGKWEHHRVLLFDYPDLNRDGVPETISTSPLDGGVTGQIVGVWQGEDVGNYDEEWWENAELLWTDLGYTAHAGWNAVFLCTLDGEDYLLRYKPYGIQGGFSYSYQLFTLENGRETVVRENHIEFDTNFGSPVYSGSFDAEAIAAFMDEINGLLAHSYPLIVTDADLWGTFQEEDRLVDTLSWLNSWEPVFVRDKNASLLENLRAFETAMTPPDSPGGSIGAG